MLELLEFMYKINKSEANKALDHYKHNVVDNANWLVVLAAINTNDDLLNEIIDHLDSEAEEFWSSYIEGQKNNEKFILIPEIEKKYGLTKDTIRRQIFRGTFIKGIEVIKKGNRWFIDKSVAEKHYSK